LSSCAECLVSRKVAVSLAKTSPCQRKREDAKLTEEIRQEFYTHRGIYGSPRLHAELRDQGRSISRKRVARLMREAGLCAKHKQRLCLPHSGTPLILWLLIPLKSGFYSIRVLSIPHLHSSAPGTSQAVLWMNCLVCHARSLTTVALVGSRRQLRGWRGSVPQSASTRA
jgi:transposase InsO family protein